jgi:hypothetical protein
MLVFPRALGSEMAQWERIRQAVHAIAPVERTNPRINRHAVKSLLDPANILPPVS